MYFKIKIPHIFASTNRKKNENTKNNHRPRDKSCGQPQRENLHYKNERGKVSHNPPKC